MNEEFDDLLEKFMELSPNVATYINDRMYEYDVSDDDVTETILIDKAYRILLSELQELGISFTVDTDTLLENFNNAKIIYITRKTFDGDNLTEIFRTNEYIKNMIDSILLDDTDDDFILPCIELFANKIGGEDLEILLSAKDIFTSNVFFKQHVEAVLDDISISKFPEVNTKVTTPFLMYLENHRNRNYENIALLEQLEPELDKIRLKHKLKVHDLEKISGPMFSVFATLYTVEESGNINNYSDDLLAYAKKIDEAHHEGNTHHIEYYKKHGIHPTLTDIAELVSDASAKSKSIENFKKRINHIAQTITFTSYELDTIKKFSLALIPLLEKALLNKPEIIINEDDI